MFYLMGSISSNTQPYTIGLTTNKTNLCLTGRTCDAVDRNTPAVERGDESRVIRGGQARGKQNIRTEVGRTSSVAPISSDLSKFSSELNGSTLVNTEHADVCEVLKASSTHVTCPSEMHHHHQQQSSSLHSLTTSSQFSSTSRAS